MHAGKKIVMTTKETILSLLNSAGRENFFSGEELAEKCGVSRTAVNKAINSLRKQGYSIEAVTNRGYRINYVPDFIDDLKISAEIKSLGSEPGKVLCWPTIDSTNSEAKRLAVAAGAFRNADGTFTEKGAELHRMLLVSGQQTAGRGRMGRTFVSPADSGIYFTLIYAPEGGVQNPALLTAAAAVSVARAIDGLYLNNQESCGIKWVNDIFLGGKKISGILTEGIANFETGIIEAAIVGIGINVGPGGFEGNLAKVAGSIGEVLAERGIENPSVSRNLLVARVIHNLLDFYDGFQAGNEVREKTISSMIEDYRQRSILIGKTVTVNPAAGLSGETYTARVADISPKAELVVITDQGEEKILHSGEVSLHSSEFV